jgi:hypothetical protein
MLSLILSTYEKSHSRNESIIQDTTNEKSRGLQVLISTTIVYGARCDKATALYLEHVDVFDIVKR